MNRYKLFLILLSIIFLTGCVSNSKLELDFNSELINSNQSSEININNSKTIEEKEEERINKRLMNKTIYEKESDEGKNSIDDIKKITKNTKTDNGNLNDEDKNKNIKIDLFKYVFEEKNRSYSIQFYNSINDIEDMNYNVEINREELLSTDSFKFIFSSPASSNGQVVRVSGRLFPLLSYVYKIKLNVVDDIVSSDDLSCNDSTLKVKYVFFNTESDVNEVDYNKENGCIIFRSTSQDLIGDVGDKFFYEIINGYK